MKIPIVDFLKQVPARCYSKDAKLSPLAGIRILDLTRIVAGPYCTMILGDLGAEVIKVEQPGHGDEARNWGPPFIANSNQSVYFTSVNRNKKSVCIDLKKGRNIIEKLCAKCDILVENFVPTKLEKMGLGYHQLSEIAPQLIYCSITGYGYNGPYKKRPGYDVIAASLGGLMNITGPKDGPPCKVGVPMTDLATGLYAHGAILAALYQRSQTGKGQWIQCNLLSTQIASLINVASNYLNANMSASRWGSEHSSIVPYQTFPTKGKGYMTVGTGSNSQYADLMTRLELKELINDPRFVDNAMRVKNRKELIGILEKKFEEKSNTEWTEVFEGASFPYGPVNSIDEVFDDPHVKHLELVKTFGQVKVVGPPVSYSLADNRARSAPPTLGQHTTEVLSDLLNYSDNEIQELKDNFVVQ